MGIRDIVLNRDCLFIAVVNFACVSIPNNALVYG